MGRFNVAPGYLVALGFVVVIAAAYLLWQNLGLSGLPFVAPLSPADERATVVAQREATYAAEDATAAALEATQTAEAAAIGAAATPLPSPVKARPPTATLTPTQGPQGGASPPSGASLVPGASPSPQATTPPGASLAPSETATPAATAIPTPTPTAKPPAAQATAAPLPTATEGLPTPTGTPLPAPAAAGEGGVISWEQAADYVGQVRTVEGRVAGVFDQAGTLFLDFRLPWQQGLTVVQVSPEVRATLGLAPEDFVGRTIQATGPIALYQGTPHIVLRTAQDLSIGGGKETLPASGDSPLVYGASALALLLAAFGAMVLLAAHPRAPKDPTRFLRG